MSRCLALPILLLAGCQFDPSIQASQADATPTASDSPPAIEIRLNIDGADHFGIEFPGVWAADPGQGGACGPSHYANNNAVGGTEDDALFVAHAWGNPLLCELGSGSLPAGNYQVSLYFAEVYFGQNCPGGGGDGSRVFDIEVEGQGALSGIDVHALGGGCTNSGGTPHVESFEALIDDGTLNLVMSASANNAMISAIEVVALF